VTWFRVDDSFGTHPKVLGIPRKDRPTAVGLWTLAGTWCAAHLTDGHLGEHMVGELGVPNRFGLILVQARLWHHPGDHCASCKERDGLPLEGFQFHDWWDWQPLRSDVEQRRKEDRQRKAEAREAKRVHNMSERNP